MSDDQGLQSGGEDTIEGLSSEQNAAIDAAFADAFGGKEDEAPDAGQQESAPEPKSAFRAKLDKQAKQEETDELMEEGLVNEDGDAPAAETDEALAAEGEAKPGEEKKPEAKEGGNEVDPLVRFVANQNGYSNERIDRLYKADPELAEQVFGQMVESYTNLSRQYLNAASPVAPGTQQQATPAQGTAATPASKLDELYAQLESFAESNGEEIVEKLLKPLRSEVIEPVRQMQAWVENQQRELIATEATNAFEKLAEKHGGIYGKGLEVSKLQQSAREKVINLADAIRAGSFAQGKPMSVTDAINRAHLVVNADAQKAATRREIVSKVQKRSTAITARPTNRRSPAQVGSRSEAAAQEAYARRAAELGLDIGD